MFDTHRLDINSLYFMSCWTFNLKIPWSYLAMRRWTSSYNNDPSSPTHSIPRHSCTDAIESCSHPYTAALLSIEKKIESTQIPTTTRKSIIVDRLLYKVNIMNQWIWNHLVKIKESHKDMAQESTSFVFVFVLSKP